MNPVKHMSQKKYCVRKCVHSAVFYQASSVSLTSLCSASECTIARKAEKMPFLNRGLKGWVERDSFAGQLLKVTQLSPELLKFCLRSFVLFLGLFHALLHACQPSILLVALLHEVLLLSHGLSILHRTH